MRRLTDIVLLKPDLSGEVDLGGIVRRGEVAQDSAQLSDIASALTVTYRVERPDEALLALNAPDLTTEYDIGVPLSDDVRTWIGDLIPERAVVRAEYSDNHEEMWRVARRQRTLDGRGGDALHLRPLWLDLRQAVVTEVIDGEPRAGFTALNVRADDALARLFNPTGPYAGSIPRLPNGAPLFAVGTIAVEFEDAQEDLPRLFIRLPGGTFLDALQEIAAQTRSARGSAEYAFRWDGAKYLVDLVERVGSGRDSGGLLASNINRLLHSLDTDDNAYFSRLVPLGSSPDTGDDPLTIAGAVWRVGSAVHAGGETTLTLVREAVWEDGALEGYHVRSLTPIGSDLSGEAIYAAPYPVVDSEAPGTLVVTGDASGMTRALILGPDNDHVLALVDQEAEARYGRAEQVRTYAVPPYPNAVADAGAAADLVGVDYNAPAIPEIEPEFEPLPTTPGLGDLLVFEEIEVDTLTDTDSASDSASALSASDASLPGRLLRFRGRVATEVEGSPGAQQSAEGTITFEVLDGSDDVLLAVSATAEGNDERLIDTVVTAPPDARRVRVSTDWSLSVDLTFGAAGHTPLSRAGVTIDFLELDEDTAEVDDPFDTDGLWRRTREDVAWEAALDPDLIGGEGAEVTAPEGEGIVVNVRLGPPRPSPYVSAWARLKLLSGRVRIEYEAFEAFGSVVYPQAMGAGEAVTDRLAQTGEAEIRAVEFFGADPIAHRGRLRVVAHGGPATWILDAVTVTASSAAYEYAERMGPSGLWLRGAEDMTTRGAGTGLLSPRMRTEWVDLKTIGAGVDDPVEVGDFVTILDMGPSGGDTANEDVVQAIVRCVELRAEYALGRPPETYEGQFERQSETRYRTGGPMPPAPGPPGMGFPSHDSVFPTTRPRPPGVTLLQSLGAAIGTKLTRGEPIPAEDIESLPATKITAGNLVSGVKRHDGGDIESTAGAQAKANVAEENAAAEVTNRGLDELAVFTGTINETPADEVEQGALRANAGLANNGDVNRDVPLARVHPNVPAINASGHVPNDYVTADRLTEAVRDDINAAVKVDEEGVADKTVLEIDHLAAMLSLRVVLITSASEGPIEIDADVEITGSIKLDYDNLPDSDPLEKGVVYRNSSNQLFVSEGFIEG